MGIAYWLGFFEDNRYEIMRVTNTHLLFELSQKLELSESFWLVPGTF